MSGAYPLHELRAILSPSVPVAGVVVRVAPALVDIATPTGLRQVRPGGRALTLGERVTVRDGAAYPAASAGARYAL